jgi:glycosyltransferase involved in cell wall biosynthesis
MRSILVSAYACEPFKGSEQGVGWNWVLQMAKNNELHVITRSNNEEVIEANIPNEIRSNITFHYYDTHPLIKNLKNKAKGLYFYYFCWQLGIISLIKKLKKEKEFQYSVHLTMGSIWMPTFLPFFNLPFIWGPVGGGEGEPKPFLKSLPLSKRLLQYIRLLMNKTAIINPLIVIPSRKAVSILTRTNNTLDVIPKKYKFKAQTILETSMEADIFRSSRLEGDLLEKEIQLVISGRLTPSKNIISAVRALHYIPSKFNYKLIIIGSGSERTNIEKEIKRLELGDKVVIINEITRNEVLSYLTSSDVFLFPSLREGGSWALMEAMAIGLPVICLKWSGMEIITDKYSAIQLPVTNPKQLPKDMAGAIIKLLEDPILRRKMGEAGRERIKNVFNWDAKGAFMDNLFHELDKKVHNYN